MTSKCALAKRAKLLGITIFVLCWGVWARFGGANDENTPLAEAVERDDVTAAAALLQGGADPNSLYIMSGTKNRSAFWIDVTNRWEILEPVAASFDQPQRESLLWVAAWHNKPEMVRVLLQKGAKPNLFDSDRASALLIASGNGNVPIVTLLLGAGANVNYQSKHHDTPLGRAVGYIDTSEDSGKTSLSGEQKSDHLETIRLLIAAKANLNTPMGWGWNQTPLQYARQHHLGAVASLLSKAGAK